MLMRLRSKLSSRLATSFALALEELPAVIVGRNRSTPRLTKLYHEDGAKIPRIFRLCDTDVSNT